MKVNQISCYGSNGKLRANNCRRVISPASIQSLKQTNKNKNVSFAGKAGKVLVATSTIGYAIAGFLVGGPIGAVVGAISGGAAAELIKHAADDDDDNDNDDD